LTAFRGNPNIKFHENPPVGPECHVDRWKDVRRDRQTRRS